MPPATAASRGCQKVDTYSVAMASALPLLEIPHPLTEEKSVKILRPCRNTSLNPSGNCAIVDFKIVEQVVNDGTGTRPRKVYINWRTANRAEISTRICGAPCSMKSTATTTPSP